MADELPATMLAVRKTKNQPGLWWSDTAPVPHIGASDVLIAVTHAGVCGTDRHIFEWDTWARSRVKVGITTGHEFVGRVVALGSAVNTVQIGQRVSGEGHIACGSCRACRTGMAHICQTVEIIGVDRDGCFCQYLSLPQSNVWPVHPDIPDQVAAVFDPLGNAVHTVMEAGVSGQTVLITGVGIIGLMAITAARAAGAQRIFVTDVDQRRLALALQLGADAAFSAADPGWVDDVRAATEGYGADVLLEMSGHQDAIRHGLRSLRKGGTAALLGLPSGLVQMDLTNDVIFKSAKVLGINGRRMFETWYQMESLLLSGRVSLDSIITHVVDLEDFESAFHMMANGEAIKIVFRIPDKDNVPCQTARSTSDATS